MSNSADWTVTHEYHRNVADMHEKTCAIGQRQDTILVDLADGQQQMHTITMWPPTPITIKQRDIGKTPPRRTTKPTAPCAKRSSTISERGHGIEATGRYFSN